MLIKRESRNGSNDLNVIYRPCTIDEMVGHTTNKKILKSNLDSGNPTHAYLFTGPPGCGKTTAARIMALGLNCKEGVSSTPCLKCGMCESILNRCNIDVIEINVGKSGTKGDVDEIVNGLTYAPFSSRCKVVIFDEAHELTKASQNLLLKEIEDGYSHVFFIFCTNHPEKLNKAFSGGRVSTLHFGRLQDSLIYEILLNVAQFEGIIYKEGVLKYLVKECKGVPRDALSWFRQVSDEGSWELDVAKEVTGILLDEENPKVIELCKTLMAGKWKDSINLYTKLNTQPETMRMAIAGWFTSCLRRANKVGDGRKYSTILDIMTVPIYDPGKLGDHKMINNMFKVVDLVNNWQERK